MQKLRYLSSKFLSQIPTNLSHHSHLCKNFSTSLTNPKHFSHSPLSQPHSIPHFRSWRSHHDTVARRFSHYPIILKQLVRSTHFKIQTRSLFSDRVVLFRRSPFQSQHSIANSLNSWSRLWKSWFPTTEHAIWGLISANVAVFMLWRIADREFMMNNFMVSVYNFTSGRVHTLLTSAFSQMEFEHLFSNMLGLYIFGTSIGRTFGPHFLLKLYLAGAVGGSILYLIHHAFQRPRQKGREIFGIVDAWAIRGLGASGAVNAIILLDIFLFPTVTHYLNFFIPVPAMLMGAIIIGTDVWRMKRDSNISGSAHLGGALVAALVWARVKKRWI